MNGHTLFFTNSDNSDVLQFHGGSGSTGVRVFRAWPYNRNPDVPFELLVTQTNNPGEPTYDQTAFLGWNIDGNSNSSQPSMTDRWEHSYVDTYFERHYQLSFPDSRLYRLFSSTFVNSGSTDTDSNLWYFMGNSFEFRDLHGTGYGAIGASKISSTDYRTVFQLTTVDGNGEVQFTLQPHDNQVTINTIYDTHSLLLNNWANYQFGYAGGTNNYLRFSPTGTNDTVILASGGTGKVNIFNLVAGGPGGDDQYLTIGSAAALKVGINAGSGESYWKIPSGGYYFNLYTNNVLALNIDTSQNATFAGTIKTADPSSGASQWKLGGVKTASSTVDTTRYVEVMIDGTLVKLAVVS